MDRFDNLSTAELIGREAETRAEAHDLGVALRARLEEEAAKVIKIGEVYLIPNDGLPCAGRRIRVTHIVATIVGGDFRGRSPWAVYAEGRLNRKDGWTIKHQRVNIDRLLAQLRKEAQ